MAYSINPLSFLKVMQAPRVFQLNQNHLEEPTKPLGQYKKIKLNKIISKIMDSDNNIKQGTRRETLPFRIFEFILKRLQI